MKKKLSHYGLKAAIICILLILPVGCTKNGDQQAEEKGRVEKMTDQAAETAVKKMRTPLNKARETKNIGEKRAEEINKVLQQQ